MTNNKYLGIFLIVVCALLSGCQDDWLQDGNGASAEVGDEIIFGGSLTYNNASNARTRTVYGDKNDKGTEIKWYEGDVVRIYCNEAIAPSNIKGVDYKVNNVVSPTENPTDGTAQDKDESTLSRATDETSGLQWGGEKEHEFFGIYPSPDMFEPGSAEANAYAFDFTNNAFTGYVPNSQEPSSFRKNASKDATTGAVTYTMYPAMRYAYMLARTSANPKESKTVGLTFFPVVTAIEVTITNVMSDNTANSTIADISMVGVSSVAADPSSEAPAIAGKFTSTYNSTDGTDGKWKNTYAADANKFTSVSIPVKTTSVVTGTGTSTVVTETETTTYPAVTLRKGDKLKFTVFLVLDNDASLSQLQLNMMIGSSMKSATLNGTNMDGFEIEAKKKNFITNIPLSYDNSVVSSNWLSQLPDETYLYQLSIPGATAAFSKDVYDAGNKMYADQTLSITDLWNKGVRCFEIAVDNNSGSTLANQPIIVNSIKSSAYTLKTAMNELQTLLTKNPREFIIAVVKYQTIEGAGGLGGRNAAQWSTGFNSYWTTAENFSILNAGINADVTDKYLDDKETIITLGRKRYDPAQTLSWARGQLFCVTRCTALGADGFWNSINNLQAEVLSVAGWGSHPDQWYQRGYKDAATRPFYASIKNAITEEEIATVDSSSTGGTGTIYPIAGNKFLYNTFATSGDKPTFNNTKVYAQEWRRVAKNHYTSPAYSREDEYYVDLGFLGSSKEENVDVYFYWAESWTEKLNDVKNAFYSAMKASSSIMHFNYLSGFYITDLEPKSYHPAPVLVNDTSNPNGTSSGQNADTKFTYKIEGLINSLKRIDHDASPYFFYGGSGGDIANFAKDMNQSAYDYIQSIGAGNISGPLGIVMMSRIASDATTNIPGYYLPQIIVNNNFRTNIASVRTMSIGTSTYNGEPLATRKQHGSATNGQMSITWE